VPRDRAHDLNLVVAEIMLVGVGEHVCADEPVAVDEGHEGDRADPLGLERGKELSERRLERDVRDEQRLGVHLVGPPRRIALDGRPVRDGDTVPDAEAHDAFVVEEEDGRARDADGVGHACERSLEQLVERRRAADLLREAVDGCEPVALQARALVQARVLDGGRRHLRELNEHRLVVVRELAAVRLVRKLDQAEIGAVAADERHAEPAALRRAAIDGLCLGPCLELGLCQPQRPVLTADETPDAVSGRARREVARLVVLLRQRDGREGLLPRPVDRHGRDGLVRADRLPRLRRDHLKELVERERRVQEERGRGETVELVRAPIAVSRRNPPLVLTHRRHVYPLSDTCFGW
jgi:hypothetical protein